MTETMLLADKGLIAPPPLLEGPMQAASAEIQTWPGVIAATHWHLYRSTEIDGADFYVGEDELGHIHLDGEVHLATSLALREALLAKGLARPFPYYRSWVECSIATEVDARHALWLFELNYRRLRGAKIAELLAEIRPREAQ